MIYTVWYFYFFLNKYKYINTTFTNHSYSHSFAIHTEVQMGQLLMVPEPGGVINGLVISFITLFAPEPTLLEGTSCGDGDGGAFDDGGAVVNLGGRWWSVDIGEGGEGGGVGGKGDKGDGDGVVDEGVEVGEASDEIGGEGSDRHDDEPKHWKKMLLSNWGIILTCLAMVASLLL